MIREIIDLRYSSHIYSMICVNLAFPIGLSHCGIVYRTGLCSFIPYSKYI